MRLGKIKCAAKVGRLMGGFAALFILRRDSQTALPKIALSVGFCLAVRVALSDRVADNGSPDLRGFGAGVAKLRAAEKSRKCADVSRSRPHLRMQSGDPMWRRMAPHLPYIRNIPVSMFRFF